MALSPDFRSSPRHVQRTAAGEITNHILEELIPRRVTRPSLDPLERRRQTDEAQRAKEQLAAVEGMSCEAKRLERGCGLEPRDVINDLVVYYIQMAIRQGRLPVNEEEMRCHIRDMLPEGRHEGERFMDTIYTYKQALNAKNYDLVNEIYTDPDQYRGRELTYRFEHLNYTRREEMNDRLRIFLRAELCRHLAESLDAGDIERFARLFDGVEFIDKLHPQDIPTDLHDLTNNAVLRARIIQVLEFECAGLTFDGQSPMRHPVGRPGDPAVPTLLKRRPKVTEAKQLGILTNADVAQQAVLEELARVEGVYAARRGSEKEGGRSKTFEQTATELSQGSTPLDRYRDAADTVGADEALRSRFRVLFRGQLAIRELHKGIFGPEQRYRGEKTADEMIAEAKTFDKKVVVEIFEPRAAFPPAELPGIDQAKRQLDTARAKPAATRTPAEAADVMRFERILDLLCQPYQRMGQGIFDAFRRFEIIPLAQENLANVLETFQDLAEYVKLRTDYARVRENTYVTYPILTNDEIMNDPAFRTRIAPIITERLRRASAAGDGGVSRQLQESQLLHYGIVTPAELLAWAP
jgi:hypothetical protein